MLALKKSVSITRFCPDARSLSMRVINCMVLGNQYLEDHDESPIRQILLDFYFEIGRFLDTYDRMNAEHYVTYTGYDEEDRFFIKEFCVDAV